MNSETSAPVKKVMIIVSRGSLDSVYPGLILANGARMEGIEASMFFTFFGLNSLVKKTMHLLKVSTVGNSALNMAMPMLGLPMFDLQIDDLCDQVDDVLTVGQFYAMAGGEQTHILFT